MNRTRVARRPVVRGRKNDKIVLIFGDINTGKTCLEDEFKPEDDLSNTTSLLHQGNNYMNRLNYGDKKIIFKSANCNHCKDIAGEQQYDVILLCFSVDEPDSVESIENGWSPELRQHFCPGKPVVVVGTKIDLRHNESTKRDLERRGKYPVNTFAGKTCATRLHAEAYAECSTKTGEGLDDLLRIVTNIAEKADKQRRRRRFYDCLRTWCACFRCCFRDNKYKLQTD